MSDEKATELFTFRITPSLRERLETHAENCRPPASVGALVRMWLEEKADEVEKKRGMRK